MSKIITNLFVILLTFALIFAVSTAVLTNTLPEFSMGTMVFLNIAAVAAVLLASVFTSAHYSKLNNKKTSEYLRRMWEQIGFLFVLGVVGFNVIGSTIGVSVLGLAVGRIENQYTRKTVVCVIYLIIYLVIAYKWTSKYGFKDSMGKEYNFHLQIETMIYATVCMIPYTLHDCIFDTHAAMYNPHTALSPNIPAFDRLDNPNGNFNLLPVVILLIVTFAIEEAVLTFAYTRGKKKFIKKHLNKDYKYDHQTDEITAGDYM